MRVVLTTDNVVALGALQLKQTDAPAKENGNDGLGDRIDRQHLIKEDLKLQLIGLLFCARLD